MNKKFLGLAVAASLVAPMVANADVTLYGHAQAELGFQSNEEPVGGNPLVKNAAGLTNAKTGDFTDLIDNARGRLGVKASEKLGDTGLTGLALFEWKIDTHAGGAPTNQREAMVGLKGGFGTVMAGALKQPYKYAGGVKYDAFVTTLLEARQNGGMSGQPSNGEVGHNKFMTESIGYISPKMSGLQFKVNYRLDEGSPTAELDGAYSLSVMYSAGGIEAFVAANDADLPGVGNEYSSIKLGGKFKSGAFAVMGQYEMIDNGGTDETILFAGARFKMGNTSLIGQFGMDDLDGVDDVTYMAVGAWHKFSKATSVYAGYRSTSDVQSVFSIGMRKTFATK